MAAPGRLLALTVATVTAMAGCLQPPETETPPAAVLPAPEPEPPQFALTGTGCIEGGGHSVHPKFDDYLPYPWEPADVLDDVGPQRLYSETPGVPEEGNTMGNYHATVVCDAWTLDGADVPDLVFGFVGMKIEPPPFDDPERPAVRHYLITVVGSSDPALAEVLHGLGLHVSDTTGVAEFQGPAFHNVLDTADHGVYEAVFATKKLQNVENGIIRLWYQVENEDGSYSPVAIDMLTTGGEHLIAEEQGWFMHLRTEDHAPLPGAGGHTAGIVLTGFERTITVGPRPDVKLAEAYIHL